MKLNELIELGKQCYPYEDNPHGQRNYVLRYHRIFENLSIEEMENYKIFDITDYY
jgi:hypothetical protein